MEKINFVNGQEPALNGTNLNQLQTNIEEAIEKKQAYSTNEQVIGTWINGKPIYRKVVNIGALPNATTKNTAHNITDIDYIVRFYGTAADTSKHTIPLPHVHPANVSYGVLVQVSKVNVEIETGYNRSAYSGYITIEYTKTTD